MSNTRKITTIVLIILTLALGVLAIVIGVRITQSQAPTDTGAQTQCPTASCISNDTNIPNSTVCLGANGVPLTCCNVGYTFLGGNGQCIPLSTNVCTPGAQRCPTSTNRVEQCNLVGGAYNWQQTGQVCCGTPDVQCLTGRVCSGGQCVTSGSGTGTQPPPPSGGGSCNSGWCTTQNECTSQGGSWGGSNDGYCQPTSLGQCCVSSAPAPAPAPAPTPTPVRKQCGGTCTGNSQCITQSPSGEPVGCRNGTCQNLNCIGSTVPGAACSCAQTTSTTTTTGTSLPNTAIFDNKTDTILLGIFSIIIGLILWKSSMFDNMLLLFKGEIVLSSKKRSYRKKVESIIDSAIRRD